MSHDLESLGPGGFEDLVGALAIKALGVDVQVMGSGRDGGRDLYTTQPTSQPVADGAGRWQGYTVVQIKHKETLAPTPADNARWLWRQIKAELDDWATRDDRKKVPGNLLFVTNVPLTPAPDVGSHDTIHAKIDALLNALRKPDPNTGRDGRLAKLTNWDIWDRRKVNALLHAHDAVRRAFSALLTPGDVLANLAAYTGRMAPEGLEQGLKEHARERLVGDGRARFHEAGTDEGPAVPLHQVIVDLPADRADGTRTTVLRAVVERSERLLKPGMRTLAGPPHLLITGAPGNGKTTIARFVVQAYRAALIREGTDLSDGHRQTIAAIESVLARLGCGRLRNRRWPMLIDLADWAQHGSLHDEGSLLRWIASKMAPDAGAVHPTALREWLRQWPWLLVLDGLDEVTDPATRRDLLVKVEAFVEDAEADRADVFVMVTTRPTGYAEDVDPARFERIDLGELEPDDAIEFGLRAIGIRLSGDTDRLDRVRDTLTAAPKDDNLRHLLRTPLQVLILALIVADTGSVASHRYGLFWEYYETIYKRERAKKSGLHIVLADREPQIRRLHEAVGFALQTRSERGDGSYAAISARELRDITGQILAEDGLKPEGRDSELVDTLVIAATKRLVLIEPRGDDGYGFTVRSLQELMAARCVLDGSPEERTTRLRLIAASPHWRNTWLFAAGKILDADYPRERDGLIDLVFGIDERASHRLGAVVPVGPHLALDIIDDGMTAAHPKIHDALLSHALGLLYEPAGPDVGGIVRALLRQAAASPALQKVIADHLRLALATPGGPAETARRVIELIPSSVTALRLPKRLNGLSTVKPTSPTQAVLPIDWKSFREELATAPIDGFDAEIVRRISRTVQEIVKPDPSSAGNLITIAEALHSDPAAVALETALLHVRGEARVEAELRDLLAVTIHREPLAEALHDTGIPQRIG